MLCISSSSPEEKKRQNRFNLDFGSMPFHKLLPKELQLIKQMMAKYSVNPVSSYTKYLHQAAVI